jgi:predicted transcriptional regulator
MKQIKRLPDAEFEVMRIAWQFEPPVSTTQIMSRLGTDNTWKPPTVLTLLGRLIEKGFLSTEKAGKDRTYTPLISQSEYLRVETGSYLDRLNENSALGIVAALYNGKKLSAKEIAELRNWLKEKGKEQ